MGKRRKTRMNTMNQGAHAPVIEDEYNAVNDFISKLPDKALSLILSHLPLREAVRTSILSKSWKHVWSLVSNLEFDAVNIAGGACNARKFRKHNQDMFVACVNQVLQLHKFGGVKSFRLQCNLGPKYFSEIDRWLLIAVNNALQDLDIDLSKPLRNRIPSLPVANCYRIPNWIFDGRLLSLKHLSLSCCTFKVPPSTTCFSSLTSLSLASLDLSQDHINIFCDCPNLQSLSLLGCICPPHLELASRHQFLPLKHLNIIYCNCLAELEILDAAGLLSFEFVGSFLKYLTLQNSAKPSRICYGHLCLGWQHVGLFYDFNRLTADFPQVETLMLVLPRFERNTMSLRLPTFSRLQELVLDLFLQYASDVLKFISSLLNASPYLQELQVTLPQAFTYVPVGESTWMLETPDCFCLHEHLREVKLYNFHGGPTELKLVKYLDQIATSLEKIEFHRKFRTYGGIGWWDEPLSDSRITQQQLHKILQNFFLPKQIFFCHMGMKMI